MPNPIDIMSWVSGGTGNQAWPEKRQEDKSRAILKKDRGLAFIKQAWQAKKQDPGAWIQRQKSRLKRLAYVCYTKECT